MLDIKQKAAAPASLALWLFMTGRSNVARKLLGAELSVLSGV